MLEATAGRRVHGRLDVSDPPRSSYPEGDDPPPSLRCLGADGADLKKGPVGGFGLTLQ